MRMLGIDPGTALMGYGVVEQTGSRMRAVAYGALVTTPDMSPERRLQRLYHGLLELVVTYHPEAIAVEELFFGRNVTTAIHVGQARGLVLLTAAEKNLPLAEYTPMQVKMAVAGWGKADKMQVQHMVRTLLGLKEVPKPDDVADALAVAICALSGWGLDQRLKGVQP